MLIDEMARRIRIPENLKIVDYAIGAKYAYVEVSGDMGDALGLSYMPSEDISKGYSRAPDLDKISEFVASLNIFEKVLGVAMLNAVSQYSMWNLSTSIKAYSENIIEAIPRICPRGRIVVVGNMLPLVRKLPRGCEVYVLERNPRMRLNSYSDAFASRIVPMADVLIVSGAALVNDTVDHLLHLSRGARVRILVGPTAGITPEILRGEFHFIAGMRVRNIEKVKDIILLGGGRWDFAGYCEEYILDARNY